MPLTRGRYLLEASWRNIWGKSGVGKSTLHYLRSNVQSDRSFRIYQKVREKIESETNRYGPVWFRRVDGKSRRK